VKVQNEGKGRTRINKTRNEETEVKEETAMKIRGEEYSGQNKKNRKTDKRRKRRNEDLKGRKRESIGNK
jgi:hypothetical protein